MTIIHILPVVPWRQNCPQLRTTVLEESSSLPPPPVTLLLRCSELGGSDSALAALKCWVTLIPCFPEPPIPKAEPLHVSLTSLTECHDEMCSGKTLYHRKDSSWASKGPGAGAVTFRVSHAIWDIPCSGWVIRYNLLQVRGGQWWGWLAESQWPVLAWRVWLHPCDLVSTFWSCRSIRHMA